MRTEDWRYIRYADGSEELYDHREDPQEFFNLAAAPRFASLKVELGNWIPKNPVAPVPGSEKTPGGFLEYKDGEAFLNGKPVDLGR